MGYPIEKNKVDVSSKYRVTGSSWKDGKPTHINIGYKGKKYRITVADIVEIDYHTLEEVK